MMDSLAIISLLVLMAVVIGLGVALLLVLRTRRDLRASAERAEARAALFERYQAIPNAETEATRIVITAQATAQHITESARANAAEITAQASIASARLRSEAEDTRRQTIAEVQSWRARVLSETEELRQRTVADANELQRLVNEESKEKQRQIESDITGIRLRAQKEADDLVQRARAEAERIAGDALAARDKMDDYARAAKALKNVIEGYGDAYLVPTKSLLDDLAAEFDHKEAGQRLKRARERSLAMAYEGRAGQCSYREIRRRETAIRFVVDAFNGKVDSLLSKVKHDNFGTLEQGIRDAFSLVNLNGEAFRDARVTTEYLDARIDELRWAVRAMEIQRMAREEQRMIKDQLREEERARKEYEKAIKAAEKEEKTLQKAMEEARKRVEAASASQRAQLEQQLQDLQKKLAEAEAKNQRALSMAQQTRRGHVYVISNIGSFGDNVYKIGLTRRLEPLDRIKELGDASVPFEFDVHAMIWAEDAPALEIELHRRFGHTQVNKVNPRKEFFRVDLASIRSVVTEMKLECHWTMVAEAREYRETLAIDHRNAVTPAGLRPAPSVPAADAAARN